MYEKLKNLESKTADIIHLIEILHNASKQHEDLMLIEPFCRTLAEKCKTHYNNLDLLNIELCGKFSKTLKNP